MYPTGVWAFQVKLAIERQGREYTFRRPEAKDQFGQPMVAPNSFMSLHGEYVWRGNPIMEPITVKGIYHEDHRWTQSIVSEEQSSNVNRNPTESYILVTKEESGKLDWGMTVVVSDKTYRLVKARDIEGLELFCDLVLQEVEPNGLREVPSEL